MRATYTYIHANKRSIRYVVRTYRRRRGKGRKKKGGREDEGQGAAEFLESGRPSHNTPVESPASRAWRMWQGVAAVASRRAGGGAGEFESQLPREQSLHAVVASSSPSKPPSLTSDTLIIILFCNCTNRDLEIGMPR